MEKFDAEGFQVQQNVAHELGRADVPVIEGKAVEYTVPAFDLDQAIETIALSLAERLTPLTDVELARYELGHLPVAQESAIEEYVKAIAEKLTESVGNSSLLRPPSPPASCPVRMT